MRALTLIAICAAVAGATVANAQVNAQEIDWQKVDAAIGRGGAVTGDVHRYGMDESPDAEGTVKHATFRLEGQEFAAMDSARAHGFTFNEAISFIVSCDSQEEIDHYWSSLSAVPEAEQCGWLKDRYGLSWQVVPSSMDEMLHAGTKEQIERVTEAFLKMKKFDIAALEKAYEGL